MKLNEVWKTIRSKGNQTCFPIFSEFCGILLTKPQQSHLGKRLRWLIGPYLEVRQIARSMSSDKALRETLSALGVRVGRRDADHPPPVLRKGKDPGIGDWGTANAINVGNLLSRRKDADNLGKPMARVGDLYDPVRTYWEDRSLEAHHIVEKGILADLHVNKGDLDNNQAPTVLLAAEFHQRLFTRELAAERDQFKIKLEDIQASALLKEIYDKLYGDVVLESLKEIAEIINSAVKDNL